MLIVFHPTYTLEIVIQDRPAAENLGHAGLYGGVAGQDTGGRKYFRDNRTGCDEVIADVVAALEKAGIKARVSFESFKHSS